MVADVFAFDRLESASTNMQREFAADNAQAVALGQKLVGEMQSCRRGRHTAVYVAIDGLIVGRVASLGVTVQVRRYGNHTNCIEQRGKGNVVTIPIEVDDPSIASISYADGLLTVGAGAKFDAIVAFCATHCLKGLSSFAGLPGTAGGAAFMNARCYGVSAGDLIQSVSYVDLDELSGEKRDLSDFTLANFVKVYHNVQGTWAYKESPFQTFRSLILELTFCVEALAQDAASERLIRSENEGYVADRQSRGHFRAPSAGSVFKNDRRFGKPSGQLIDEAGLKGLAVGGAQIAPWHGNFIVNTGSARAGDIRALVEQAQAAVRERTGFVLEPEVIFV